MTSTTNDGWEEIEGGTMRMPEGYVGNLTAEHQEKLRLLWDSFFKVCDKATGSRLENTGEVEDWGQDESAVKSRLSKSAIKNSGIEQDDGAKDIAQKRAEEANMDKLLKTYGPEALRNTFWSLCKQDHPDTTMLRFLRARKWDVERATAMMASTLRWRLDTGVDKMSENGDLVNGKEIPKYIDQQATGKVYAKGCNVYDQPVCYVHFKKHLIWGQPSPSMKKFIITQMESWRLLFVPPNDKMVILFDCSGFGPSNLDMPNFLYVLQCLQSYFPECLAVLYLHNAPWILKQAWGLVKGLLDPVVRNKVVFTSTPEDLKENIPEDRLLEFVGGDVDMKFEWVGPEEGENDLQKNKAERDARWAHHRKLCDTFEKTTREWVGTNSKESEEERKILAKRLRLSQFDYEPYWRGKTVHHRNGDLPPGNPGIVRWEYILKDGEKVRQIVGQRQCKKTLVRELQEIEAGASVDWAEKHTREMIKDGSWGRWDTCDDLPPRPTGFKDGQLVFDGAAPVSAGNENATSVAAPASATAAPESKDENAANKGDTASNSKNSGVTLVPSNDNKTYVDANNATKQQSKSTSSSGKAQTSDYKKSTKDSSAPKKRMSLLGTIKSKIAA